MSTDNERFLSRFGFHLPVVYRSMSDRGLLASDHPHHLQLTDFHWLTMEQILANSMTPVSAGNLLPFAESGNGDRWCWNTGWRSQRGIAVVFIARDQRSGEGYAADFAAALYRKLLEEFSGSWLLGTFVHSTNELEGRFAAMRRMSANISSQTGRFPLLN